MTFHHDDSIEELLKDLKAIKLKEIENEGKTTNGQIKHWHIFQVIVRK